MPGICGRPVDVSGYRFNVPEPVCVFPAGHDAEHPCSTRRELPGEPCRFCGGTLVKVPCPACWTPVPENVADQKALFARIGLSLEV